MEVELFVVYEWVVVVIVIFFVSEQVLQFLLECLQSFDGEVQKVEIVVQFGELLVVLEVMVGDFDMLFLLMVLLCIDDVIQWICIIELILEIYVCLNQVKVCVEQWCKGFGLSEIVVQFGVQFKFFGQGIINVLVQVQDFECCDE